MAHVNTLKDQYPQLMDINEYVEFLKDSVILDGHFSANDLRSIADVLDDMNKVTSE